MAQTTITIKTIWGSVLFEHKSDNNTIRKTLEEAVGQRANLWGANLSHFVQLASRDMLFIFERLKPASASVPTAMAMMRSFIVPLPASASARGYWHAGC